MALPAVVGEALEDRAPRVECRRSGKRWRVEMGERSVLVDHSVGMRHLATLLANPGYAIPAADLAAGLAGTRVDAADSAQPVLDDLAKRKYKRRLTQLETDIDELESRNDLDHATILRAERDWLIAELAAATGLSGRTRTFTTTDERARVAVGKAIRRALNRISQADPTIAQALKSTIQTGLHCTYHPH